MKKRISAITIILIILSALIGIRLLFISIEIGELNTACALLRDDLSRITEGIYSVEWLSKESTWLSCILQEKDANINITTTLYMLIFSILLTIISWKMDKLKKKV